MKAFQKNSTGFTVVELLVAAFIIALLIGSITMALSHVFSSARKGNDTLTLFQNTSIFLTWLRFDLRTMVIDPPPDVIDNGSNTQSFSFNRVVSIATLNNNSYIPVQKRITYRIRDKGIKKQNQSGVLLSVFSIERIVENEDPDILKTFMPEGLTDFKVVILDNMAQPTMNTPENTRKVSIKLATNQGSEIFETTLSIYSPFIRQSEKDQAFLSTAKLNPWRPGATVTTFDGVQIPANQIGEVDGAISVIGRSWF